jgi:hypothetical protein
MKLNINVLLDENEFSFSQNPTINIWFIIMIFFMILLTGSDFAPYVTTSWTYIMNNKQLLAIGKLAQPVPTSRTTDMTFYINIDR